MNNELQSNEQKTLWGMIRSYVPFLSVGVILALLLNLVVSPSVVVGESMEGSLHDGDYLLVNKVAYMNEHIPDYGDVVIIKNLKIEGSTFFIKRVIGKPGDEINVKNGQVTRNGNVLVEDYIKEEMDDNSEELNIVVPKGEVFVMGDNRNHSLDSRILGTFNLDSEVVGKVVTRVIPYDQSYKVK